MLYNSLQSALAVAERIFELLDSAQTVVDAPEAEALHKIEGSVTFDDVTFGYDPQKPVLKEVSLSARPGDTVALVGPTGADKTTIVNLLSLCAVCGRIGARIVFRLSKTRRITYTLVAAAWGSSLIWNQGALRSR
jgi:ABC-type bacteriocin/lantibiotic exporter with double-glycine peptidase domain